MRARDYDRAWTLADRSRQERDPATRDDPSRPYHQRWVWDGTDVRDRDVLVRCYHGLGDTLQFARYLPVLAGRARSVTLEAPPRLLALLSPLLPGGRLIPFDDAHPLPPSPCDIEITELDVALRVAPDAVPVPYLTATPARLPAGTVAVCHAAGDWDRDRNVPADLFRPLCATHPVLSLVAGPTALPVLNPEGCPFDIAGTAALVAGAALVVTVDTMIAHLAGAIGRPTWLLLKAEPDWRWSPAATDSAWYPTMRLYTQPAAGDWAAVVAGVERDLARATPDQGEKVEA